MLIFEKAGKVLPEQDKTNIPIEFQVPNGMEKLVIDYRSEEHTSELQSQR